MNTFSVSNIIKFYFYENISYQNNNYWKYQTNIGILYHKIINLYLMLNNQFNIYYFLNYNNLKYKEKYILFNLFQKTINFLNEKKNWQCILYEKNINYNNIYGKPDIIFEYKNNTGYNNHFLLLLKYYYDIYAGFLNYNIIDLQLNINDYNENNYNINNNKKQIILVDWKCYSNTNIFFYKHENLKTFLYYIIKNTKYNKCMLQMNLYKFILEHKYNCIVSEMYVYLINSKTFTYQLIPIISLKKEFIIFLIDFFTKNNYNINEV